MSTQIYLYDTTLRDGSQQLGISFSLNDKLSIARKLDELGVPYIEGGYPGSNPKDADFFRQVSRLGLRHARVAAFGSTRRAGIGVEDDANVRALLECGAPAVTIVGKSWDFHVETALGTTLDENLAMIEETVTYLKARGREVIFDAEHFFDGFARSPEYAMACLKAAEAGGADWVVLCDTNGGSLTAQVRQGVQAAREALDAAIGIHTHNDCELGVANALAGVDEGARQVQGTMNGYGERCGNANLCSIIPNLQVKMGYQCIEDHQLAKLVSVSRFVSEVANRNPDPWAPFVGENAFATKAGLHASALLKDRQTYEHMDPALVGNDRKVSVSELSGRSNLAYKASEWGLELQKDDARMPELVQHVKDLEQRGYQFDAAEASLELLVLKQLGLYRPLFTLQAFRVLVDNGASQGPTAEATVRVIVDGAEVHTAALGNGPVHAVDYALRKALGGFYPAIEEIKLLDYKVRVLEGSDGTGAGVRVLIESGDGYGRWNTLGVSTNIIEASWDAVVDSLEYGMVLAQRRAAQTKPLPETGAS